MVYQPGVYLTPTIDIWAVPPHVTREDLDERRSGSVLLPHDTY